MKTQEFQEIMIESIENLDVSRLEELEEDVLYFIKRKHELMHSFDIFFKVLKSEGYFRLTSKPTKCKYCFQNLAAYEFYDILNDEFIIRYVIDKDGEKYCFHECENDRIPCGNLPF